MHFKIITAGWKAGPWVEKCVDSIEMQDYSDYDVCLVDDASYDPELSDFIEDRCIANGWNYILRKEQVGAIRNQVDGIRLMQPEPEDVIIFLDMDDRFAHKSVLSRLVYYYNQGPLMTYGSYTSEPFSPTCHPACPYPEHIVATGDYRRFAQEGGGIQWNHLRTIKASLFLELSDDDFKGPNGEWLTSGTDSAFMFPCMELARGRIKFIEETLLIYNSENPLSDWRRQPDAVDRNHEWILSRPRKA